MLFFFSSRRRHTRWPRDWSSDVCSSDLFLNDLNKVKGKVFRSVKDQERIQISRISKVQKSLFPNRNLQEREVAFLYFMNKYGIHIWQELLDNICELSVDTHKLIYLLCPNRSGNRSRSCVPNSRG